MQTNLFTYSALWLAVLGTGQCWANDQTNDEPLQLEISMPTEWVALDDALLDTLRGGFDIGNGLKVSFGFMRSIAVNGEQVSRTSFHFPDLKSITPDQARVASESMAQAGVVQLGRNNVVNPTDAAQPALSAVSIVQNSLNNQHISALTQINTTVNSMGLIKSMNALSSMQEALLGSLNVR